MSRAGSAYAYEDPHDRAERIKRQRAERERAERERRYDEGGWVADLIRADQAGQELTRRQELARRPRPNRTVRTKRCEECGSLFQANHRDARFCPGGLCQKRNRRARRPPIEEGWH